ncbi:uncharacterized protein PSFLO_04702 [Pseudozyma flocculosa]|uniref:Uncharacterized protein n=1 Tax=Pseudozyma flocculosa TaxID=84751 RepID=A0A5C3F4F4_9BASI|nr:uncharacterized protein PSFLO_04702 [Pseudozyma flocculosa]
MAVVKVKVEVEVEVDASSSQRRKRNRTQRVEAAAGDGENVNALLGSAPATWPGYVILPSGASRGPFLLSASSMVGPWTPTAEGPHAGRQAGRWAAGTLQPARLGWAIMRHHALINIEQPAAADNDNNDDADADAFERMLSGRESTSTVGSPVRPARLEKRGVQSWDGFCGCGPGSRAR